MNILAKMLIAFVVMFFGAVGVVQAAGLTLTKVGSYSAVGVDYSVVEYVGGVPMFEGTATPGAQVAIQIKSVLGYATTASPSGIWQFVPVSIDTGTNPVTITSGGQTLSFSLLFNSVTVPTPTATPAAVNVLPETGAVENLVMVIMAGFGVMFFGRYLNKQMHVWEGKKK